MALFTIVCLPPEIFQEQIKGMKCSAYYEPASRVVFVSGDRVTPIIILHETVHAVRDRILPECVGIYFDILFDLLDTFLTINSYKRGLWHDLKATWRNYRMADE
jgi:hypothetical protein